jgi:hypothetical protein
MREFCDTVRAAGTEKSNAVCQAGGSSQCATKNLPADMLRLHDGGQIITVRGLAIEFSEAPRQTVQTDWRSS